MALLHDMHYQCKSVKEFHVLKSRTIKLIDKAIRYSTVCQTFFIMIRTGIQHVSRPFDHILFLFFSEN